MSKKETKAKKPTTKKSKITKPAAKKTAVAKAVPKKSASKPATTKATSKTAQKKPAKKVSQASTKSTTKKSTQTQQPVQVEQDRLVTVSLKFHPDSNGGHHHIIVENVDDNHISVGLTTNSQYDKKHKNVPLEHSPLANGKQTYASRKGTVDKKNNYNSPKQGKITTTDATKVKQIADKAKAKNNKMTKK